MIKLDWHPSDKKLREYSLICLAGFGIFGLIATFKFHNETLAIILGVAAIGLPICGLLSPKWVKPVYLGMSLLAFPIGFVISNLILLIMFLFVFTPISLLFKLIGRDALKLKKTDVRSYWKVYPAREKEPSSYFHQS
jgi:hypothetical protein